jgi:hypothetical protein
VHGVRSPRAAAARAPAVAPTSMAESWTKTRGNEPYTSAIRPLYEDLGGQSRKGVLTRGADDAGMKAAPTGKTCKTSAKRPWCGPSSCTRTHRTLGHILPAMRTLEGRTCRCSAEGGSEMR